MGRRESEGSLMGGEGMGMGRGTYLMGDVHIECGRLDIKWDSEGEVRHIEDSSSHPGTGEGPSTRRGRRSWI